MRLPKEQETTGVSRYSGLRWAENTAYDAFGSRRGSVQQVGPGKWRGAWYSRHMGGWSTATPVERHSRNGIAREHAVAWVEKQYEKVVVAAIEAALKAQGEDE